jgi:YVTN family beta-propeller protein
MRKVLGHLVLVMFVLHGGFAMPAFADAFAYVLVGDGTVSVIDATLTVRSTIKVGAGADSITVTPDGTRAYVINPCGAGPCGGPNSSTITVIDTTTRTVIDTIKMRQAVDIAFTPDGTRAYVTSYNGIVSVLDTSTNTIIGSPIALDPVNGGAATKIAMSRDGARAYVMDPSDEADIWIISTSTNTVTGEVYLGNLIPLDMALAPDGTRLYVSDVTSYVSVIDTTINQVVDRIQVGELQRTLPEHVAIRPDGKRLYVLTSVVLVIDTTKNAVVDAIPIGHPYAIAITPDGQTAYVTASTDTRTCSMQPGPFLFTFDPFGDRIDSVPVRTAAGAVAVKPLPPRSFARARANARRIRGARRPN